MAASYVEVRITADALLTEHLIAILGQIGFEGFWEDEGTLRAYIRAERWSPALQEEVGATIRLVTRSSRSVIPEVVVSSFEDRNWNEEWERTIRPIDVTDRITITPTWHPVRARPGQTVLTIDPKMSFGTGYHESTRLMIEMLERCVGPGIRVLDVGTGTGVLAIAALKLGATSAVAVDIDAWSYENAQENARLNHVEQCLTVMQGDISLVRGDTFQLVMANIQRNILEGIMGELAAVLSDPGILLLSGLLKGDRDAMLGSLETHGLKLHEERAENEWIGLAARKGT
jgi:ribosomal protein L11 methyltransferase